MRAWIPVLVILCTVAASWATATEKTYEVPDASRCADCHAAGLWDPAMEAPRITQGWLTPSSTGQILNLAIENPWLHTVQELHTTVQIHGDGLDIDIPRHAVNSTHTGSFGPSIQDAFQIKEVFLESGVQHFQATMSPGTNAGHDLDLSITVDGVTYDAEDTDAGQSETIALDTGVLAGVERVSMKVELQRSLAAVPGDTTYTIDVVQWTGPENGTYTTTSMQAIEPDTSQVVAIPVVASDALTDVLMDIELRAWVVYDHQAPSDPDEAGLLMTYQVPVYRQNDTLVLGLEPVAPTEEAPGVPFFITSGVLATVAIVARGTRLNH